MRFEILGPLTLHDGDRHVHFRSHRQRVILAVLLLNRRWPVSVDFLIDAVWGERPPTTARAQIQICVCAIRRAMEEFGAERSLETEPPGYVLQVGDDQIDAGVFERCRRDATALAADGRLSEAAAVLRHGVRLWHGPALTGVTSSVIAPAAARLDEERFTALETCVGWELELGWHPEVVGELVERVRAHPLRERSRAQLMLALQGSGRQAAALEVYREGRRILREQLGVEPGLELRQTEALVLANDAG